MATPLGLAISTAENQVSQCDDQTLGSTAEALAIHSGQEPTRDCKKVGIAVTPLANSSKQVSVETDKALRKPTTVFGAIRRVKILSLLPSKTWSFISTKKNLKSYSLKVVQCSTYRSIGRSR